MSKTFYKTPEPHKLCNTPEVLYVNVASSPEPPSRVIPPPLITADVLFPLAKTILWSFKFTVVEFTVVVVPDTVKSPVTVKLRPTVTSLSLSSIRIGKI